MIVTADGLNIKEQRQVRESNRWTDGRGWMEWGRVCWPTTWYPE